VSLIEVSELKSGSVDNKDRATGIKIIERSTAEEPITITLLCCAAVVGVG
jgi:hypothetical protein